MGHQRQQSQDFQGLWGRGRQGIGRPGGAAETRACMNLSGDSIAPLARLSRYADRHRPVRQCHPGSRQAAHPTLSGSAGGHNGLKNVIARLGGELPASASAWVPSPPGL